MRLFTLNRLGVVTSNHSSSNQCKDFGWKDYRYEVRITCTDKLDNDDFVIEHSRIHDEVARVFQTMGSCERLCLNIERAILKLVQSHGVKVKKIYVKVMPMPEGGIDLPNRAFMELESKYR